MVSSITSLIVAAIGLNAAISVNAVPIMERAQQLQAREYAARGGGTMHAQQLQPRVFKHVVQKYLQHKANEAKLNEDLANAGHGMHGGDGAHAERRSYTDQELSAREYAARGGGTMHAQQLQPRVFKHVVQKYLQHKANEAKLNEDLANAGHGMHGGDGAPAERRSYTDQDLSARSLGLEDEFFEERSYDDYFEF